MTRQTRASQRVRERSVRMVYDPQGEYASEWEAIRSNADKIGCSPETSAQVGSQGTGEYAPRPQAQEFVTPSGWLRYPTTMPRRDPTECNRRFPAQRAPDRNRQTLYTSTRELPLTCPLVMDHSPREVFEVMKRFAAASVQTAPG
jgi:hypothetical protein